LGGRNRLASQAGFYCPNPLERHACPEGHYCREGSQTPTQCPMLTVCAVGTETPMLSFWEATLDLVSPPARHRQWRVELGTTTLTLSPLPQPVSKPAGEWCR
jgi:hypothetical protein